MISLPRSLHTIRCQGRCIRFAARVAAYDSLPSSPRTIRCQGHCGRRSMIDTTHTFLPLPRRNHVARVSPSAQQRLAADAAGASRDLVVLYHAVSCRRASRSIRPPAAPLKPGVGRSLNPSVSRPCAWRAASAAAWVPDRAAFAWVASGRLRRAGAVGCGARRAGAVPPAILAARTARMCGGRPPAAPLPNQPPNRARSRHRWRGPKPGRFVHCRRVPMRASVYCTCQRRC